MGHKIYVNKTTRIVVSWADSSQKLDNCDELDFNSLSVTEDAKPATAREMVGGNVTEGLAYTKPTVVDYSGRDAAWIAAQEDLVDTDTNNIANGDATWKKCMIYGLRDLMDGADWTALRVLY